MSAADNNQGIPALTSIRRCIHYAANNELEIDTKRQEQDEIDVKNFIKVLAEVALAVATRRLKRQSQENQD